MVINIKQQQKISYNPRLASEKFIKEQLTKAVDKKFALGMPNINQGFISLWFRVDKETGLIKTKGALIFANREYAEEDFELNKQILDSARCALYIYAVGSFSIRHVTPGHHVVKTVLLHAEGLETL